MKLGRQRRRFTMMCGWLAALVLAVSLLAMGSGSLADAVFSVGLDYPLRTPMPSGLPSPSPTRTRTLTPSQTPTRTPTPTSTRIPCVTTPTPGAPFADNVPLAGTAQRQVAHCVDDAFVTLGQTNALDHDGAYLRMGGRPGTAVPYVQYIDGLLFRDVRVPQGARVVSATLRLETWYQSGAPVLVEVAGQLSPQANDFSPANPWPQQRPKTALRTAWTLSVAMTGTVISPDLAGIVEEIVGQSGWKPGNNLVLLISPVLTGQQFMDWQAYDFSPANAARLTISYETPPATITPTPTATATASPTSTVTPTGTPTPAPTPRSQECPALA